MQNLIRTCRNKFKPFYDKLIMPLIKLSNLGYNYQGELLVHELEELRSNKLVRRWYNIVQVCEAFASIEIFEDPEILSDGCQAFTFISSEEAGELRKSEHLSLEELAAREHERPIEYKPSSAQNSDQLWIQDQEELERLISKYKSSATEADRLRRKLLLKIYARARELLESGKVMTFVSEMVKSGLNKESSATNVNEDLVLMIDEAVSDGETSVHVSQLDGPVAFARRKRPQVPVYPKRVVNKRKPANGSKLTTRAFDVTLGRFIPSRSRIFFWMLGIIGTLMIILGVMMG